jgi:hypothetical protein
MLRVLKRLGLLLVIGGLLGAIVTLLVAPDALTWFQTPGAGTAICNCADVARQTAYAFVHAQLVGTAIGAVGFTIIGELVHHLWAARRRHRALASSAPPPPPMPPPAPPAA